MPRSFITLAVIAALVALVGHPRQGLAQTQRTEEEPPLEEVRAALCVALSVPEVECPRAVFRVAGAIDLDGDGRSEWVYARDRDENCDYGSAPCFGVVQRTPQGWTSVFASQGEYLGMIPQPGRRADLAVLGANVPHEHGVDVYRWTDGRYRSVYHRTCATDTTASERCPTLSATIDLRAAGVRSHATPPSAPPRRSGAADLQLDWVFVQRSRGTRFYRLTLFVRVRGGPVRRLDLGEVPEPLPSLCRRGYPEVRLPGGMTERFAIEHDGSTYTVRRQERTGATWGPWRAYDPDATRTWHFEGPTHGSVMHAMYVDGAEMPCGARAL